jgi:hypothetical protein
MEPDATDGRETADNVTEEPAPKKVNKIVVVALGCLAALIFVLINPGFLYAALVVLTGAGDPQRPEVVQGTEEWIWENCDFSAEETYFVPVRTMLHSDPAVGTMDCDELREYLPVYRQQAGDQLAFLTLNPGQRNTLRPLPDLDGLALRAMVEVRGQVEAAGWHAAGVLAHVAFGGA